MLRLSVFPILVAVSALCDSAVAGPADLVDTRIGTDPKRGSCLLGPCVPHGSVYPSPGTEWPLPDGRNPPPSGYYPNTKVVGFSQLHTQGTGGVPSYGLFRVVFGEPSTLEIMETHPYHFRGRLIEAGITISVAATAHGSIYEYSSGNPTIDHLCKIGRECASDSAKVHSAGNVMWGGGRYCGNWNPAPYDCWFYSTCEDGVLRIAVSFKDLDQARRYYDSELRGRTLREIAEDARREWDRVLSSIEIGDSAAEKRHLFYTHLFHAFVQPRNRVSDGLGWDDHYTLWDTWKTLFPLLSIVDSDTVAGVVNHFAERFERTGCCTSCYTQGKEYKVGQGGDEADCVIADALAKNLPGIDRARLLPLLYSRWKGRTEGYRVRGYVADGEREDYCWRMKSGSATMSFAFQDYCAGKSLQSICGTEHEMAVAFLKRSFNWTNVWNASAIDVPSGFRGFPCARKQNGDFMETNPRGGFNKSFYEATGWEYSFFAPHAMDVLFRLSGGRTPFVERLEYALENNLIAFGNEPSFQTPWLFTFAGRTDLTSKWPHTVFCLFPSDGCPGYDDSGAMGALYVFLFAGMMPMAGSDIYLLHAPMAERIVFNFPERSHKFMVVAPGARPGRSEYKVARLNGKVLEVPIIRHADIVGGGELFFEMQ